MRTRGTLASSRWRRGSALLVFFIGCGLLTVAVVELASNKSISAVTSIIGGPLVVIGLAVVIVSGRLRGEK